jgi:hypothetical protein
LLDGCFGVSYAWTTRYVRQRILWRIGQYIMDNFCIMCNKMTMSALVQYKHSLDPGKPALSEPRPLGITFSLARHSHKVRATRSCLVLCSVPISRQIVIYIAAHHMCLLYRLNADKKLFRLLTFASLLAGTGGGGGTLLGIAAPLAVERRFAVLDAVLSSRGRASGGDCDDLLRE